MSVLSEFDFTGKQSKLQELIEQDPDCFAQSSCGDFVVLPTKFCSEFVEEEKKSGEDVEQILNGNSDLIPNEYEGGFKVWEGLTDIIQYLKDHPQYLEKFSSRESVNILDVGCGSGLLGIFLAQMLRSHNSQLKITVFLQDFNESVIKSFTVPNVILNECFEFHSETLTRDDIDRTYRFLYGDWSDVTELFHSNSTHFDLIVSAETLYSEQNYDKLGELFQKLLKPNGEALIGTKSHYFGVGGGTWSFLDYLEASRPQLHGDILHEIDDSLLRHILILKFKSSE